MFGSTLLITVVGLITTPLRALSRGSVSKVTKDNVKVYGVVRDNTETLTLESFQKIENFQGYVSKDRNILNLTNSIQVGLAATSA